MFFRPRTILLILSIVAFVCSASAQQTPSTVNLSFDFRNGTLDWQADFSDYPPAYNPNNFYELQAGLRSLPAEISPGGTGFFFQGREKMMSGQTTIELFKKELFQCLDETLDETHGIYLDKGTSLFETLESISAEDASRSIAEGCATIAAQVEHVRFYLDVLNDAMQREEVVKVDWREIWESVREVTPEEWAGEKRRLRESCQRLLATMENYENWEGEYGISGALAVLVHTAYHLGGIRQALGAIKSAKKDG